MEGNVLPGATFVLAPRAASRGLGRGDKGQGDASPRPLVRFAERLLSTFAPQRCTCASALSEKAVFHNRWQDNQKTKRQHRGHRAQRKQGFFMPLPARSPGSVNHQLLSVMLPAEAPGPGFGGVCSTTSSRGDGWARAAVSPSPPPARYPAVNTQKKKQTHVIIAARAEPR